MTVRDRLEIGLKPDAPFRRDNLPEHQVTGNQQPAGEGRSPVVPNAVADAVASARLGRKRAKLTQRAVSGRRRHR